MDAYTWTDSDGDTAAVMPFRDYAGLIETREQAEGIIAWLRGFFGIEP